MGNRNQKKAKKELLTVNKPSSNQTQLPPATGALPTTPMNANKPSSNQTQFAAATGISPTTQPVRRLFDLAKILGVVGFLLGLVNIVIAIRQTQIFEEQAKSNREQANSNQEQTKIAKDTYDRATGKIAATIEFAEYRPGPVDFPNQMRTEAFGGSNKPYYKDIDLFVKFVPRLWINNTGAESIEAIKITTSLVRSSIDTPKQSDKNEPGIVLREEEREEILLSQAWRPERAIQVSLLKGLLGQMVQVQSKTKTNVMHSAVLRVYVSGRLTGSTVFGSDNSRYIECTVWWMPSGFPEQKCQEVLKEYQSVINSGPQRPTLIQKKD